MIKYLKDVDDLLQNKHLWETLNNLGCTPKKSLTLQFPNLNIFKTKDLVFALYLEDIFDGDGCFF